MRLSRNLFALTLGALLAGTAGAAPADSTTPTPGAPAMKLGHFSMSLAVKDLAASREFYEKLGFRTVGGNGKNFAILQSDTATIGLFQGMFPKNTLTFNPGWDRESKTLTVFDDVRDLQKAVKARGLAPVKEADEASSGPAHFMLVDPDGNPVLVDQHVAKPAK